MLTARALGIPGKPLRACALRTIRAYLRHDRLCGPVAAALPAAACRAYATLADQSRL